MKRFMSKKVAVVGIAVGLTLGLSGAAFAYFLSTGTGAGTATVGSASVIQLRLNLGADQRSQPERRKRVRRNDFWSCHNPGWLPQFVVHGCSGQLQHNCSGGCHDDLGDGDDTERDEHRPERMRGSDYGDRLVQQLTSSTPVKGRAYAHPFTGVTRSEGRVAES
jgi:hypothetical protein